MADVVVVGAGLGGLAAAARLAKLGHRVTVLERNAAAGGAIRRVEKDGFGWDAGPSSTTLPAVLRDLFRKSGRPLERYVDLVLRTPARRHVFEDGSHVDLPTGSRADQIRAVDAGLGTGSGAAWAAFVDAQGSLWDRLRLDVLDLPDGAARLADRDVARSLGARTSLGTLLTKSLPDDRMRAMAGCHVELAGSTVQDAPAYAAVSCYVERSFGVWGVPAGGLAAVTDALVTRLGERKVRLELGAEVTALLVTGGRVSGVTLADGTERRADVVVAAIDARTVFGRLLPHGLNLPGRRLFGAAIPAIPPSVTHVGLHGDVPALPDEVVLHGDPLLVLTTCGSAPPDGHAWTVQRRGDAQEDVLVVLARRGIDVRDHVVTRLDRSADDLVRETGGSPYGLAWPGWRAHVRRAAQSNPVPGLHLCGSSVHPGPGVPYVAWGAAHIATRIGPVQP